MTLGNHNTGGSGSTSAGTVSLNGHPVDMKLATLNVARYHELDRLGAVAPGYLADIAVLPDLEQFEQNLGALDVNLTAGQLENLDRITKPRVQYPNWMIERQSSGRTFPIAGPS